MIPRKKFFGRCLNLVKTSESVAYCRYYSEIINFCIEECPHNGLPRKIENDCKVQ
jgi:hypothetical protein